MKSKTVMVVAAAVLFLAAGCGGSGRNGRDSLIRVEMLAPGAQCPAGGLVVLSGLDADGDGQLSDSEVQSTSYVCNGAQGDEGRQTLVRQEDAGPAQCPYGGRLIHTGLDADGDGYLDADEVQQTTAVCNGEPGQPGAASLFRLVDEPAGANCPAGGTRIETGLDANGNGSLDDGEVTATAYVCDGGGLLVNARPAAWGGVCPRGGVMIETGIDDDADGMLDPEEVSRVDYVCNVFLVQLVAGSAHTCALMSDGTVRCWGWNNVGQLGDGTTQDHLIPVRVTGLSGVAAISAGSYHTCTRQTDGTARCWGQNASGELGIGTVSMYEASPVEVVDLSGVLEISAGGAHTCALVTGGTVRCWGNNERGQLGDGTLTNRTRPVNVSNLQSVSGLSAGLMHTCARLSGGNARCWGLNNSGQLGDGTTNNSSLPVAVSGLSSVVDISAGDYHSCAVISGGTIRCWGYNAFGQLGDGATTNRLTPVVVNGLVNVASVTAGGFHTCSRQTDGTARCWGGNSFGQLGDGTTSDRLSPVIVPALSGVVELLAGFDYTCSRHQDGTARCWGDNSHGQLGDGTQNNSTLPVKVPGFGDSAP